MKGLKLDWDDVLGKGSEEEEPPSLIILGANRSLPASRVMSTSGADRRSRIESMGNEEIEKTIKRIRSNILTASKSLPDKGAQLISFVKSLEEEQSRRKSGLSIAITKRDVHIDAEKSIEAIRSGVNGFSRDFKRDKESAKEFKESEFGALFLKKVEEDITVTETIASVESRRNVITRGNCTSRRKKKFKSLNSTLCSAEYAYNDDAFTDGETVPNISSDKESSIATDTDPKQHSTVVVVDEDENIEAAGPAEKSSESVKPAKLYYPSRDSSESVEICYSDISCLTPKGYLTSPIMNFYIRYLQLHGSSPENTFCNYHFFNTFFYEKLKQALSHELDRQSFFAKFRRWWKGVDIFEKAYVLIPINEDQHWSLVIVCFPDKEDESGPIILHLDSLGHHCSKSVFENIRRYLISEWEFINHDVAPSNVPIADNIWKLLPRRIEDKILSVPQQRNYYDCGLFVLFFMQRFMEEAPERLKMKNLSMFGRRWFKPEQASMLREKIHGLLVDEFDKIINVESSS